MKTVFYYAYKNTQFFPRHPDADLGSIIHNFYENYTKWDIKDIETFNKKWNELIDKLNKDYKINKLQRHYYPVQWHSNFYAVKKQLLKNQLIKHFHKGDIASNTKKEVWIEDKEKIIAGKADMLIYDKNGNVTEVIDFKTGNIFEKKNGNKDIKNAYKLQLALYSKVIMDKQGTTPALSIIDMNGKKFSLELPCNLIIQIFIEAESLKEKINSALTEKKYEKLSNPTPDNCYMCDYRKVCSAYKNKLLNHPIKKNIDVKGKIRKISDKLFNIVTGKEVFPVINQHSLKIRENHEVIIYNLYISNKNNLYTQKNTIIEYE